MLKAGGVISDIAAGVEAEPHLVQLLLEDLRLPGHQILHSREGCVMHGCPNPPSSVDWSCRLDTSIFSDIPLGMGERTRQDQRYYLLCQVRVRILHGRCSHNSI